MPAVGNSVVFYDSNIVRAVKNWDRLNNAVVSGNDVVIQPGGSAGIALSNDYFNGLYASRYRQCYVEVESGGAGDNYNNKVELVLEGVYQVTSDDGINDLRTRVSLNCTMLNTRLTPTSGIYSFSFTRYVEMLGYDFKSLLVYVINNSDEVVTLKNCIIKRSRDISGSQVGQSIGWSVSLDRVIAYEDGCELYYSGDPTPDVLKWQEDSDGNFAGIMVNDERLIEFSRVKEIIGN